MPHSAISPRWANEVVITADGAHQPDVAGEHDGDTHPGDGTVDGGDHRLGERHEVGVRAAQVVAGVRVAGHGEARFDDLGCGPLARVGVALLGGDVGQHAEVGTGAEATAGAREHDADDGRVGLGLPDGSRHLVAHPCGPGVELVGTVEGDRGDRIIDLVRDMFERCGHPRVVAEAATRRRNGPTRRDARLMQATTALRSRPWTSPVVMSRPVAETAMSSPTTN